MANIGYLQVVRHCNHLCGFCSNPTSPYTHDFDSMKVLVDDLVARDYFGVILTGGEPTLHPELPRIARYARDCGLHVRMITNGHNLGNEGFAQAMADAGLQLVHVSVYSTRPEVEEKLRGVAGSIERAELGIRAAHAAGIEVNINCVINAYNADHLHENIAYWIERHPYIRHFVWNNLDPSMGRAEVNQDQYTPRLAGFEISLHRALTLLESTGRTLRVEKVPLCYMTDFAWASTETRKIVKLEERIVHFLDEKQSVRQTDWDHLYADVCNVCTLRPICGGLFNRGDGYDPAELYPVFVPIEPIVEKILHDPGDPTTRFRDLTEWRAAFDAHNVRRAEDGPSGPQGPGAPGLPHVGRITEQGRKLYASKRASESRKAERRGVNMEHPSAGARAATLSKDDSGEPNH
jgi:MoaA/NifB/PqqE/SkfB family radical SAM enzyme